MKFIFVFYTLFILNIALGQIGKKIDGNSNELSIIGTWQCSKNGQTYTLLLLNNGNGEFDGDEISFLQKTFQLIIKQPNGTSTNYNYKLSGNTLTLSGGDLTGTMVFKRNAIPSQLNDDEPLQTQGGTLIIGTWIGKNMNFTFKPNGILLYNNVTMNYTTKGSKVYCVNEEAGVSVTYDYEINQNQLLLKYNGNTIMLQKQAANKSVNYNKSTTQKPNFLGSWVSSNNEHLTMMEGGKMTLEGYELTYTYDASTITVTSPAGNVVFTYMLSGNKFNVTSNGITTYYTKAGSNSANSNTYGNKQQNTGGGIDKSMVGKWSRMGASGGGYNSSGSSQYTEYFVLNANGTYEYYSESSRSANGNNQYGDEVYRGSTGGDGVDRGTWKVQGNVIIANSQTRGVVQYAFEKRNNKNGDPCIVIDGTEYVSFYQRSGW